MRILKIVGYVLYLILVSGLSLLLILTRDKANWLVGELRGICSYLVLGLTAVFLLLVILSFVSTKKRKIVLYGLLGLVPCLISIPSLRNPIFSPGKALSGKIETVELQYIAWVCYCPNWIFPETIKMQ